MLWIVDRGIGRHNNYTIDLFINTFGWTMNDDNLLKLCHNRKWPEVQEYLSSDATDEEKKQNVMMTDSNDNTALHWTCCLGGSHGVSYNIIKMLVDVGGKDLVMAKNKNGFTALNFLCWYICWKTVFLYKALWAMKTAYTIYN